MPQMVMRDRDLAEDLLFSEKALSERYNWTTLECQNLQLRNTIEDLEHDTHLTARSIYEYLNQRGWYRPRMADQQTVSWFNQAISSIQNDVRQVGGAGVGAGAAWGTGQQGTWQTTVGQTGYDYGQQTGFAGQAGGQQVTGQAGGQMGGQVGGQAVFSQGIYAQQATGGGVQLPQWAYGQNIDYQGGNTEYRRT